MQGELPSNMRAFWRFLLRKNLPADSLSSVSFAAFGLGDSGNMPLHGSTSPGSQPHESGGDDVLLDLI